VNTNSTALKLFLVAAMATLMPTSVFAQGSVLIIPNPAPAATDSFGSSTALDGSVSVIGDPGDEVGGIRVGTVYVFGASGVLLYSIPSPNPVVATDAFGVSTAIAGSNIVVGSSGFGIGTDDNVGIAYVFDTATGLPIHELKNPEPDHFDFFGVAVSISGDNIAIGAPNAWREFPRLCRGGSQSSTVPGVGDRNSPP
jgi:hypothetical protein